MEEYINCLADLKKQLNHPYRLGEFLTDETNIFVINEDDNNNSDLIESCEPGTLIYMINWEDNYLFAEDGTKIEPVYKI